MLSLLFASQETKGGHGVKFGIPRAIWAMVVPQSQSNYSLYEMLAKRKMQATITTRIFDEWEKRQEEEMLTFGL